MFVQVALRASQSSFSGLMIGSLGRGEKRTTFRASFHSAISRTFSQISSDNDTAFFRGQLTQPCNHLRPQCGFIVGRTVYSRREIFCFEGSSLYGSRQVPIPFSKKSRRNVIRQTAENNAQNKSSTRVRMRPRADWHKRNYLTSVLIPSLFTKRSGNHEPPQFPVLKPGEICITWIGHASFLIQTHEVNVLIDPNWAKWLKVIKRLEATGFRDSSSAGDRFRPGDARAFRSSRSTHSAQSRGRSADRRPDRRGQSGASTSVSRSCTSSATGRRVKLGPIEVSLTPCYHWGARFLADLHRGFGGFVVRVEGRTIFHCGDSAFFDGFAKSASITTSRSRSCRSAPTTRRPAAKFT